MRTGADGDFVMSRYAIIYTHPADRCIQRQRPATDAELGTSAIGSLMEPLVR